MIPVRTATSPGGARSVLARLALVAFVLLALAGSAGPAFPAVGGRAPGGDDAGPSGATRPAASPSPRAAAPAGPATWAASIARTMPADLTVPHLVDRCLPATGPGWLSAENHRPGTPLAVRGAGFPGTGSVLAVSRTVSAGCGDTVELAVSAPVDRYTVRAWRVGWYGGDGGRIVWTSTPFAAGPQNRTGGGGVVAGGPSWRSTTRFAVTPGWLPGLYLLEVRSVHRPGTAGWVPLVVRGAVSDAGRSQVAYLAPALTWAAYNPFGGASLYRASGGPSVTAVQRRARVVALGRPLVEQGQRQVSQYTVPLVQTMEAAGVDIDYLADVDVDAAPSLLAGRAEIVLGSHAEYATTRLYDALEAARNTGTNLAFLGANQIYWHVRLGRDATGAPRAVHLYRQYAEDPARKTAPAEVTTRWRDAPLRRPEAALIGAQYRGLGIVGPLLPLQPPAWTGWASGQSLPAAASGEVDAANPAGPPGVQALAQGTTRRGRGWVDAVATYYVAPSGAAVLDTASINTGCLARDACYALPAPPVTRRAMSELVVRVVRAFAAGPRFGATHPADPTAGGRLTGAALANRYGKLATGTSVTDSDD